MNYESIYNRVKDSVFASGTIANGYNGESERVKFSLVDGSVYVLHFTGCHKCPYPKIFDVTFANESNAFSALGDCSYVRQLQFLGDAFALYHGFPKIGKPIPELRHDFIARKIEESANA